MLTDTEDMSKGTQLSVPVDKLEKMKKCQQQK